MLRKEDWVHFALWYTVYDVKTGAVVASGTSKKCAQMLGYKTTNSFVSSVNHARHHKPHKYEFFVERVARSEIEDAKRPTRVGSTDRPKRVMDL